ncbi:MAG: nucleotidyltransferase substrate binding protein [Planctomycetes bacterium]|nr:nucleotidyltransferase substrate binding protein [Planctomycetota bacterium]
MSAHLENFQRAVKRLAVVLGEPESRTQREASIHCFEFAFELGWKAIQARLRSEGLDAATPRACLEQAWRAGWIDDVSEWLDLLRDRNLTSHTYKESLALELVERLPEHLEQLQSLAARLER